MWHVFLAQPSATGLARPQNPHTIKAMSLIHQLSRATAQAQRDAAERKRLYDLETERLVDQLVATEKEKFTENCWKAARNQKNECCIYVAPSDGVRNRSGGKDVTEQKLRAMLVELGFHDGTVRFWDSHPLRFRVTATWPVAADAAGSQEPSPERASGTFITCPICHEHRPAVVLIPCGHVVCRDCQRCQQLRQCPMCRGPVSSASNALFMDWQPRTCCAVGGWSSLERMLQTLMVVARFCGARGPNSCIFEGACSQLPSANNEKRKLKSLKLVDSIWTGKCPADLSSNPEICSHEWIAILMGWAWHWQGETYFSMTAIKSPMQLERHGGLMANLTLLARRLSWTHWICCPTVAQLAMILEK